MQWSASCGVSGLWLMKVLALGNLECVPASAHNVLHLLSSTGRSNLHFDVDVKGNSYAYRPPFPVVSTSGTVYLWHALDYLVFLCSCQYNFTRTQDKPLMLKRK